MNINLYNDKYSIIKDIEVISGSYNIPCNEINIRHAKFPETKTIKLTFSNGRRYEYQAFITNEKPWPKCIEWKKTLEDILDLEDGFYVGKVEFKLCSIEYDFFIEHEDEILGIINEN